MKKAMKFLLASVVAVSLAGVAVPASAAKFLVVGGGSTTGVYYQVAPERLQAGEQGLEEQGL